MLDTIYRGSFIECQVRVGPHEVIVQTDHDEGLAPGAESAPQLRAGPWPLPDLIAGADHSTAAPAAPETSGPRIARVDRRGCRGRGGIVGPEVW